MTKDAPAPLQILYGHKCEVTAIVGVVNENGCYDLYSGDEEGTVIIWNLTTCKISNKLERIIDGRIQVISHLFNHNMVAIQSRQGSISIFNKNLGNLKLSFPSCDNNFSRADLKDLDENAAFISYTPTRETFALSKLIRKEGDVCISKSSSIIDNLGGKPIFDTHLLIFDKHKQQVLVFVGFEDGLISVFINKENKLSCIKTHDLNQGDFVSAFDVSVSLKNDLYHVKLICGFPSDDLFMIDSYIDKACTECKLKSQRKLKLDCEKKIGVGTIKVKPDKKIVSVATWDAKLKIFSTRGEFLANLNYHNKKINDICFLELIDRDKYLLFQKLTEHQDKKEPFFLMACSSSDGTISLSTIY